MKFKGARYPLLFYDRRYNIKIPLFKVNGWLVIDSPIEFR